MAGAPATVDLSAVDTGSDAYDVFDDGPYEPLPKVRTVQLNGYGWR